MRLIFSPVIVLLFLLQPGFQGVSQTTSPASGRLTGRWRVTFRLSGENDKNLIFDAKPKGSGSFQLLDTGPDDKPVLETVPAVWSELTNNRISFSGEAELPIGTCCREIGTMIFKGKFKTNTSISGGFIFVTSVDEEESPYKYRSHIGTFTATLVNN